MCFLPQERGKSRFPHSLQCQERLEQGGYEGTTAERND